MSEARVAEGIRRRLAEGARLYNDGAFWEAHEAWEQAWLTLRERDRSELADLVQALILASAAFENLQRGKPDGFATQGAKALHRLRARGGRLPELGVREGDRFREELLDVYLDAQRRKVADLDELDRPAPELVVEPP